MQLPTLPFEVDLSAFFDEGAGKHKDDSKLLSQQVAVGSSIGLSAMDFRFSDLGDGTKGPLALTDEETAQALAILSAGGEAAYRDALTLLHQSTREAWENQLTWEPDDYADGVAPFQPDAASLARFLESEIVPWYDEQRTELVTFTQQVDTAMNANTASASLNIRSASGGS